jgi:uncharacterized protein
MQLYIIGALVGLFAGIASGLFGVGGGIVLVPAMIYLMGFSQTPKVAVGTSLAIIIPTALIGIWRHHNLNQVHWKTAAIMIPTGAIGAYIGVWLTTVLSNNDLKRAFGVVLMLVGLKLLLVK